jgi:hypothetical protein
MSSARSKSTEVRVESKIVNEKSTGRLIAISAPMFGIKSNKNISNAKNKA